MTEQSTTPRGAIPGWLAIILIAAAMGAAGWYVVKSVFKGKPKSLATGPVPVQEGRTDGALLVPRQNTRGNRPPEEAYMFKRGAIELLQTKRRSGTWLFNNLTEAERLALHLNYCDDLAAHIGLSEQDRAELRKLKIEVPLTPEQRANLSKLFFAYLFGGSEEAGSLQSANALFAEMEKLAAEQKKQDMTPEQRSKRILEIVKPEQIEKANQWLAHQAQFKGTLPLSPPTQVAQSSTPLRDFARAFVDPNPGRNRPNPGSTAGPSRTQTSRPARVATSRPVRLATSRPTN